MVGQSQSVKAMPVCAAWLVLHKWHSCTVSYKGAPLLPSRPPVLTKSCQCGCQKGPGGERPPGASSQQKDERREASVSGTFPLASFLFPNLKRIGAHGMGESKGISGYQ